jgi:hypothetical protein
MGNKKIAACVTRKIDYSPYSKKILYRATIRVYLKSGKRAVKDLAFVRVRAESRLELEKRIRFIVRHFAKLLREEPSFVDKIGRPEELSFEEE